MHFASYLALNVLGRVNQAGQLREALCCLGLIIGLFRKKFGNRRLNAT